MKNVFDVYYIPGTLLGSDYNSEQNKQQNPRPSGAYILGVKVGSGEGNELNKYVNYVVWSKITSMVENKTGKEIRKCLGWGVLQFKSGVSILN